MRRTTVLGAATAAALAAGSLAVTGVLGSSHREAPKILADPTADNTDVYAFTAPDAPHSLTVVANWIPMEEPAGRPVLRQARSSGPLLREDRQHRRRPRGRGLPLEVHVRSSATRTRSWTRRRRSTRSTTRTSTSSRRTTSTRRPTARASVVKTRQLAQRRPGRLPPTRARRRSRTTPRSRRAPIRSLPGGGKTFVGPVRRCVLRRPRRRVRRDQHRQAGPAEHRPRQPGRRQGRRGGLQHALVRPAGAGVRGHP